MIAPETAHPNRTTPMAEIDVERVDEVPEPDYTTGELIYWIIGILCIPLVPILMIWIFTPWSGM